MHAGKGDGPRPLSISRELFNLRHSLAFDVCLVCGRKSMDAKSCPSQFHQLLDKIRQLEKKHKPL